MHRPAWKTVARPEAPASDVPWQELASYDHLVCHAASGSVSTMNGQWADRPHNGLSALLDTDWQVSTLVHQWTEPIGQYESDARPAGSWPALLTPLVGREAEVAAVRALLLQPDVH